VVTYATRGMERCGFDIFMKVRRSCATSGRMLSS
jgi:hypothetical protein